MACKLTAQDMVARGSRRAGRGQATLQSLMVRLSHETGPETYGK